MLTLDENNKNQPSIMQPIKYLDEAFVPEIVNEYEFKSIPFLPMNDNDNDANANKLQAFLFMDANEQLQVSTVDLFCKKLKCAETDKIKVISIFGNTGDGKSHTMNHTFFGGEQVFKTSMEQNSCTIGVHAAMQRELGVLCLDTEGLLGTTNKNNRRMRMLLKILAISDIVIYRTRSERLHSDMFEFLGTASQAFCTHFTPALQNMGNGSTLGPAVIIFHETRFTKPFESTVEESAEDKLRNSFARLNYETSAFSSLRYVGIQTDIDKQTSFTKIIAAVRMEIENTAVRSPRQPGVVFKAMKLLNHKFDGEIIEKNINPFPEQYFTCTVHCESCNRRCQRSMGHITDNEPHYNKHPCNYQHQFENKVFLCKACYTNGKTIEVSVRTQTQTDSSWYALAKYAWKGAVIECPQCGEIYRARQYWYGNKSPEVTAVRSQIVHVWKCSNLVGKNVVHSAQMVVDSVSYITEAISNISAPSAKALSGWIADKMAPSYWRPNNEIIFCYTCKRNFDKTGLPRHHCRGCGEGFCHACSQNKLPVPARGWQQPVRVCNDCYQTLQNRTNNTTEEREGEDKDKEKSEEEQEHEQEVLTHSKSNHNITGTQQQFNNIDEADVLARKYGETIYKTLSSVATVALVYPKEIIKDSARPTYWVPDAESPSCFICKALFGTAEELSVTHQKSGNNEDVVRARNRHHCRRCGQAVCSTCSKGRMPVPERGWQTDVRVCDSCVCLPITTTPQTDEMKAALAAAINSDTENDHMEPETQNGNEQVATTVVMPAEAAS